MGPLDRIGIWVAPGLTVATLMFLQWVGCPRVPPLPPAPPAPPPTEPKPDEPPKEPAPDPLAAIVRISAPGVGCSATVIGPRRPDGRYWVLSAAHCVERTGQRWTMRFRDGRQLGAVVTNYDRRADWAWLVTDANNIALPYALAADVTPEPGVKVWHAGFGVHVPGNREDGELRARADNTGKIEFWLSVSSGDSGGGIIHDGQGRVLSAVCCTTEKGASARVWGAAPEQFRRGQRDAVDLDEWVPLDIPVVPIPEPMPPK